MTSRHPLDGNGVRNLRRGAHVRPHGNRLESVNGASIACCARAVLWVYNGPEL
jgi:hypothetical protein